MAPGTVKEPSKTVVTNHNFLRAMSHCAHRPAVPGAVTREASHPHRAHVHARTGLSAAQRPGRSQLTSCAQIARFCVGRGQIHHAATAVHNGGYARGYRRMVDHAL